MEGERKCSFLGICQEKLTKTSKHIFLWKMGCFLKNVLFRQDQKRQSMPQLLLKNSEEVWRNWIILKILSPQVPLALGLFWKLSLGFKKLWVISEKFPKEKNLKINFFPLAIAKRLRRTKVFGRNPTPCKKIKLA